MQGNIRVIPIKIKLRPLTICHYTCRRINFNVSRIIQIKLRASTSYFNSLTLNTCCLQIKIDLLGINLYEIPPFCLHSSFIIDGDTCVFCKCRFILFPQYISLYIINIFGHIPSQSCGKIGLFLIKAFHIATAAFGKVNLFFP